MGIRSHLQGISLNSNDIAGLIVQSKTFEQNYYENLMKALGRQYNGYNAESLRSLIIEMTKKTTDYSKLSNLIKDSAIKVTTDEVLNYLDSSLPSIVDPVGLKDLIESAVGVIRNENGSSKYAKSSGNINELFVLDSLVKWFNSQKISVSIVDTSEKYRTGAEKKYDIQADYNGHNLYFEVKTGDDKKASTQKNNSKEERITGVVSDPDVAKFDVGQFSSEAFAYDPQTYKELQDNIKDAIVEYMNHIYANAYNPVIMIRQEDILITMVVKYLIWRLQNNIPFFVSNNGVLLCSEVLEYLNSHNKAYISSEGLESFNINLEQYTGVDDEQYNLDYYDQLEEEVLEKTVNEKYKVLLGYGKLHS